MPNELDEELLGPGTVGGDIIQPPSVSETQTAAAELTEEAGFLRSRARYLNEQTSELHERSVFNEWDIRTRRWVRQRMQDMLENLADRGFGWRDIAAMVGVSVPAVQKWRRGERATGENRQRVASLVAACDLIAEQYGIDESAAWFETPVGLEAPVTPISLWCAGRPDLVFAHAGGHADADEILTDSDPQWRERHHSGFEAFRAGDGKLSIRAKER